MNKLLKVIFAAAALASTALGQVPIVPPNTFSISQVSPGASSGGTGANTQVAYFTGPNTLSSNSGFTTDTSGNVTVNSLSSSSWVRTASGSAAAPSWSFTSETGTGLFFDSANTIGVSIAGTEYGILSKTGSSFYIGAKTSNANLTLNSSTGAIGVNAGGTNQSITLTPSGTGAVALSGSGAASTGLLSFPSATTSAGGITFGTDSFLYRTSAGILQLDGGASGVSANSNAVISLNGGGGNVQGLALYHANTLYAQIASSGTGLIFNTGANTLALTLDSSQVATFASTVRADTFKTTGNTTNLSIQPVNSSTANNFLTDISGGTMSQTSGINGAVRIAPTYNQSASTAANTDLLINRTQTAVGSGAQLLIDAQVSTTSKFSVDNTGQVTVASGVLASGRLRAGAAQQLEFNGRTQLQAPSDGVLTIWNNAQTDFTRLQFGGTTSSFPAIKRSSATLLFRLADDSSNADIQAQGGTFTGEIFGSGAGFRTNGGYVVNAANQAVLDYSSGARLIGFGADASTNGIFSIQSKRSDGSNTLTFLSFDSAGAATLLKTVTSYNGIATAGNGVVTVQGAARATAQTGANASVATYTVGAADASFEVSANILVTTATTHAFTCTCAYTDEGNTARTITFTFSNVGGTFLTSIANTGGTVPYEGVPLHIRAKASTSITIATTGTFTSVVYNVEGVIRKLQ